MPSQKALDELRELHREFLALATGVDELVAAAVRAIRDPESDRAPVSVNGSELAERWGRLTERCQRILLLYQPVARDFRAVIALLRMGPELEHIGHLTAEITGRATALRGLPGSVPNELDRMAGAVSGMVHRAADAYLLLDAGPVHPVAWTRLEVSALARVLLNWLAGVMRMNPAAVEPGLALCAVIQDLNRIAEHAAVLAGELLFLIETGTRTAPEARADSRACSRAGTFTAPRSG
jgi:phosphate transport system protein